MLYISTLFRLVAIAIIIAPVETLAQQPVLRATPASTANQRFVLFQGTYGASVDGRSTSDQQAVFKIDTVTGDVWMFVTAVKDGQLIQRWSKIEN